MPRSYRGRTDRRSIRGRNRQCIRLENVSLLCYINSNNDRGDSQNFRQRDYDDFQDPSEPDHRDLSHLNHEESVVVPPESEPMDHDQSDLLRNNEHVTEPVNSVPDPVHAEPVVVLQNQRGDDQIADVSKLDPENRFLPVVTATEPNIDAPPQSPNHRSPPPLDLDQDFDRHDEIVSDSNPPTPLPRHRPQDQAQSSRVQSSTSMNAVDEPNAAPPAPAYSPNHRSPPPLDLDQDFDGHDEIVSDSNPRTPPPRQRPQDLPLISMNAAKRYFGADEFREWKRLREERREARRVQEGSSMGQHTSSDDSDDAEDSDTSEERLQASGDEEDARPWLSEVDREPYAHDLPPPWSAQLEEDLKARADVWKRGGIKKRNGPTRAFIRVFGLKKEDNPVLQIQRKFGINPENWTHRFTEESIFRFEKPRFDSCFEVQLESMSELPFRTTLKPWISLFCPFHIHSVRTIAFHAVSNAELARLIVLSHAAQLDKEQRLRAYLPRDHRGAVVKKDWIVQGFRLQPVKDELLKTLSDRGWGIVCQEMGNLGWVPNRKDSNRKHFKFD